MKTNFSDQQYLLLVDHILEDKKFNNIANYKHHGTDRLSHSLKVSYYSYKIAKKIGLDFEATARAGLLHDFFTNDNEKTFISSLKSLFNHSNIAVNNAFNQFNISEKEKDIIETHMFPLNLKPTKYTEGWIVNLVDKAVGLTEFGYRFKHAMTLWLFFLINIMK